MRLPPSGNVKVMFTNGGIRTIQPAHIEKIRDGVHRPDNIPYDTPDVGVLSAHGYHVGINGLSSRERRIKLDAIFRGTLRRVDTDEYMQQWGEPETADRLKKLAKTLAKLVMGHKARQNAESFRIAIAAWEEDLSYLKRTYFDGRYRFHWPLDIESE